MSFFIKGKGNNSLNRTAEKSRGPGRKGSGENDKQNKSKFRKRLNEEISSDSETEGDPVGKKQKGVEDEEIEESAQEKKLRLAKLYLEQLREEEEKKADDDIFESDLVAGRLQDDVLEQRGKLQRQIAKDLVLPDPSEVRTLKGHKLPVTCLVISPDDKCIFSASKDGTIIKWDVESGKKLTKVVGGKGKSEDGGTRHRGHVLSMAITSDGKYLATGDMDKLIMIWEASTLQHLSTFTGHRASVTGLAFRRGTHDLYSASHDRSIKVWNVDERAYVETLFGHQDAITGLDCLTRERCVTAGGRDRTVRVWKIAEESQLVFHGHESSIDCIQLINEENMITGGDDGGVCLWTVNKKKPLTTIKKAHGTYESSGLEQPCWVSSVAALLNSDVVATGSHDSKVQVWKCGQGFRGLEPVLSIPVTGFVNSLKFANSGKFLVAGVGQEHRLGRWWRIKEAKNALYIIPMKRRDPNINSEEVAEITEQEER